MASIRWFLKTLQTHGPKDMLRQLYHYDYIKTGTLVGTDRLGNKYFENLDEQHGRHRWVEYNTDLGHREPTRIQPEWHGWMHHMTDAPPTTPSAKRGMKTAQETHVPFESEHEGGGDRVDMRINPGVVVPRGYNIPGIFGNHPNKKQTFLVPKVSEGLDGRYKQPGNPLSDVYSPNKVKLHEWTPEDPGAQKNPPRDRARDLELE